MTAQMWEVISWLGSFGFGACAIPQVISVLRVGNNQGMTWGFLLLWLLGEVCTLAYILHTFPAPPLVVNYIVNGLCLIILIWYRARPRETK